MTSHTIVILIDHKGRDLMGASLIAYHLEKLGYQVHLEPLQAFKASILAWKPCLVILNHIVHENMADFSSQLHQQGILVACLLNEGLCLTDSNLEYMSKPQYSNIHCDLFLTWNERHTQSLIKYRFVHSPEQVVTVGSPRFDFYKHPWNTLFIKKREHNRINVLINSTFAMAHFYDRPEKEKNSLYKSLGDGQIKETIDYKKLIMAHHEGMLQLPAFIQPLIESDKFNITLRPHPREEITFYQKFIDELSKNQKPHIQINTHDTIQSAIINTDIVINCEDCTTSVEAWICNKPTITLTFSKHPVFFTRTYSEKSPLISEPEKLVSSILKELSSPNQEKYSEDRNLYLQQWLYKVDGNSSLRSANAIHKTIIRQSPAPHYPNTIQNLRRAIKLRFTRTIDEPYNTRIRHIVKRIILGDKGNQSMKYRNYLKAVRPSDAESIKEKILGIHMTTPK